ncbi:MAG TPA: nucleoside recognition domain-containing protein [Tissierellaceae bacterium]
MADSIKRGLKKGLLTLWKLTKVMVPVYFFVTFLKVSGILNVISKWFGPIMGFLGLPGEASIVLVIGSCLNLYAGIGAIASLPLNIKQITILSVMLSFSHNLFVESAIAKKTGVSLAVVVLVRISLAIISGLVLNIIL